MSAEQYKNDFQTPPEIAKYMVSLLPEGVQTVLEPTPGCGHIVRELKGYDVTAPKDFFDVRKRFRYDGIVMNPPFAAKYAFLQNAPEDYVKKGMKIGYQMLYDCLQMADVVIALMPWFTLSDSDVRLRTLKNHGMVSLTALPRKTFQYARIQTVVIHFEKGFTGTTEFHVYDVMNQEQIKLL